jgi:hypothetical protein
MRRRINEENRVKENNDGVALLLVASIISDFNGDNSVREKPPTRPNIMLRNPHVNSAE